MEHQFTETEREILSRLTEEGGFTTGRVAKHVSYCKFNKRARSAAVREWLLRLEREGLVAKLDDQKPVCWVRTSRGTDAIAVKGV